MCQVCGHALDAHYSWSGPGVGGGECSLCLVDGIGRYADTGGSLSHTFVTPKDYAVSVVAGTPAGMRAVLVLSSSLPVAR